MPRIIEDPPEFLARHGADQFSGALVKVSARLWLLSDGAGIALGQSNEPVHFEPPADKRELLDLRRKYHHARAIIFSSAFSALKNSLLGNGVAFSWDHKVYGPDPGDPKRALLQLRALAADQRRQEIALTQEIENLPEVRAARERAAEQHKWQAEQDMLRQKFVDEIRAIELEATETIY